jgi:hypothetical protein
MTSNLVNANFLVWQPGAFIQTDPSFPCLCLLDDTNLGPDSERDLASSARTRAAVRHPLVSRPSYLLNAGLELDRTPPPDRSFCLNQLEDTSHLFVGCPRLRPLWNVVSPSGRPHVGADVPALVDALSEDLPPMHPEARNTVILALLWTVWKSRNRMVFDADFMSTPRILAMLVDHLRLWVVCAPLGSTQAPCCLGARLSLRLCLSPCPVFPPYPASPHLTLALFGRGMPPQAYFVGFMPPM